MKNVMSAQSIVKTSSSFSSVPLAWPLSALSTRDPKYPKQLLKIPSAPWTLFAKGGFSPDASRLAVIGTRRPSESALSLTKELCGALVEKGHSIVSGLALGIDTQAHKATLDAGGHTIAVLPCGIEKIYPWRNGALAERLLFSQGALVSEYPGVKSPERWHFVQRNRLISGLSDGVLFVEGGLQSGSMHTARFALLQNRPLLVPVRSRDSKQGLCPGAQALLSLKGGELSRLLKATGRFKEVLEYHFEERPVAQALPLDELECLPSLLRFSQYPQR